MSIWPIEPDPLPNGGTIEVTQEQFAELARLAERLQTGVISDSEFAAEAIKVVPDLKMGVENRLVIRDYSVSNPRYARRFHF